MRSGALEMFLWYVLMAVWIFGTIAAIVHLVVRVHAPHLGRRARGGGDDRGARHPGRRLLGGDRSRRHEPPGGRAAGVTSAWSVAHARPRPGVSISLTAPPPVPQTHTPLDGLPLDPRVTYICVGRDPRDVALSMDRHVANLNRDQPAAAASRGGRDRGHRAASGRTASTAAVSSRRSASASGAGSTTTPTRRPTRRASDPRSTSSRASGPRPRGSTSCSSTTTTSSPTSKARCGCWPTTWGSRSLRSGGPRWSRRPRSTGCGSAPR